MKDTNCTNILIIFEYYKYLEVLEGGGMRGNSFFLNSKKSLNVNIQNISRKRSWSLLIVNM